MAAGLGFKTFTTGEVLTAADTNGYLMQGILVFASAAARDAAITSPQEGQFAYLKDTNATTYYTGSAWAASGGGGGKVLQVVVGTSTTSVSNSTSTYADTGLTATITPATTSSRILVLVDHGTVFKSSGNANNQLNFRLFRGATQLVFSSSWYTGTALNLKGYHGIQYVDSPASISALTYKTQFRNESNTAAVDVIAGGAEASTGSIILLEIGA